jgi:hypothetical protein
MTDPQKSSRATPLAFALFGLLAGCSSLDRFDTKGSSAYCGGLVARPPFADGLLPSGHPPSLILRLNLDVGALTSRGAEPVVVGKLSTDDAASGLCSNAENPGALFTEAPLRTIPTLDHDLLSMLEFPTGRDYNFFGWVDSSCQGTMLAVTSLMRNDDVELRVLKPAPQPGAGAGPEETPGFGMFYLHRDDAGCPF